MAENMIKFLRGNVASLPKTATEGALYFTKDEGVYLGLADGSYHRYGDFITVSDVASLPAAGAHENCMYYCVSENILAKWNGTSWVQINKQKTLAELGGVDKSVYNDKIAALEQADTDNATAISDLKTYVGTIPETSTATDIVAYVQEKTAGIATDTALEELTGRVATAEGKLNTLNGADTVDGSVAKALKDAKDYADTKDGELQTKIDGIQDTIDSAVEAATADLDYTAVGMGVGKTIKSLTQTDGKIAVEFQDISITKSQISDFDHNHNDMYYGKADVDTAVADAKKAGTDAQSDVDALEAKVGTVTEGKTVVEMIAEAQANATYDDTALKGRVATIEGDYLKAADKTELSNSIADVKSDVDTFLSAADIGGEAIDTLKEIQDYISSDGTAAAEMTSKIGALETTVGKAADGENEATGLVKAVADNASAIATEKSRAEGVEANLAQADADNLAAAKKYADDAITALKIGDYAKQSDLDAHTGDTTVHITADERSKWNTAEGKAHTHSNKALLDTYTQTEENLADAVAKKHEHANAAELAKIEAGDVAKWNAAQANAEATAATALSSAKTELEGKITAAQTAAEGKVTELANGAVKTNTDNITALQNGKADKATTLAGYGINDAYTKTETYTKDEVQGLLTWGEF